MTKFSYVPFKVSNLSFPITVEFSYALSKSSGLTLVPINQYFNYLYMIINFVTASPTYVVTTVAYIPIPQLFRKIKLMINKSLYCMMKEMMQIMKTKCI